MQHASRLSNFWCHEIHQKMKYRDWQKVNMKELKEPDHDRHQGKSSGLYFVGN